ncbi:MAG: DNA-protecting protein DprA [Candidatus Methanophagaceae archaeon]|nr:MAG: DNA-protecting protein DprA [Methanophagales archaeon]
MDPIPILTLEETSKVGPKTIEKVLSIFPSFKPSDPSDLIEILKKAKERFGRISVPDIQAVTNGWNKAHEIWEHSQEHNIHIISMVSPEYPKCLSQISNPPVLLHVRGNIDALNKDCIAIVGTREPTEYGIDAAERLGALFAKRGYVVVSGLAKGIDAAAHQGALRANGITIAVLAHGLHTVYPSKNKELANAILKNNGALVSEYSWGTKANRRYFVDRDRIQSGLSLAVFVVETGIKGGTMHTVKFCKEQKRILVVLKHPSDLIDHPKTSGNAQLISEKQADIVFENDDDIDLVIREMKRVKKELLNQDKKKNHRKNSIQMTLNLGKKNNKSPHF